MATPLPIVGSQAPTISTPESKNYTKVIAGLILVGILLVAVVYVASYLGNYHSATALQIEIAGIGRGYLISSLIGFAEFTMKVNVWSTGSSDVALSQIRFQLSVDSIAFPVSPYLIGTTLVSGQYSQIPIGFITHDPSVIQYISQHNSYEFSLSMTAWATSGTYSAWSTASYSNTYSWQPCYGSYCVQ